MVEDYARFVKHAPSASEQAELTTVDLLAGKLRTHLLASARDIDAVHVHRASSKAIQDIVSRLLTIELGFREEVVLTPELGFVTSARPDFVHRLSAGRGVLAEVERGGTTTNNHDLKDMWKTHIALDAHHLFLIVPHANWNEAGQAREKPFLRVTRRLSPFFGNERREVDVLSVHLFAYGQPDLPRREVSDAWLAAGDGAWRVAPNDPGSPPATAPTSIRRAPEPV